MGDVGGSDRDIPNRTVQHDESHDPLSRRRCHHLWAHRVSQRLHVGRGIRSVAMAFHVVVPAPRRALERSLPMIERVVPSYYSHVRVLGVRGEDRITYLVLSLLCQLRTSAYQPPHECSLAASH